MVIFKVISWSNPINEKRIHVGNLLLILQWPSDWPICWELVVGVASVGLALVDFLYWKDITGKRNCGYLVFVIYSCQLHVLGSVPLSKKRMEWDWGSLIPVHDYFCSSHTVLPPLLETEPSTHLSVPQGTYFSCCSSSLEQTHSLH